MRKPTKFMLALLMALVGNLSASAYDFEVDGIYYDTVSLEDLTCEVTYRVNESGVNIYYSGDVVIPSSVTYEGKTFKVTSIGSWAFNSCDVSSVTIPNSVTVIGDHAFSGCKITSITIPNSVTKIGDSAFSACLGLTSITIPNSVTDIGRDTFSYCYGLTSITIPNSVTEIGRYTFRFCSGLESINIPNSVTNIGYRAFEGCLNLTSVTIPSSVNSIGSFAFYKCSCLTSINIQDGITEIGEDAFCECSGLKSINIPNSVTTIGSGAFISCNNLTSVTIPNSVTEIGDAPFIGCSNMESFTGKFSSEDNRCLIIDGTLNSFAPAGLTSYTIPSSVTKIGTQAFVFCTELESVTIPNSVTEIGLAAFSNCHSLTAITIPNSVTEIGDDAFYQCFGLTSVTIGNSVTSIGKWAFYDCNALKEITSLAITPPSVDSDTFEGVSKDEAVLKVPTEAVDAYKAAEVWKDFTNIVGISEEGDKKCEAPEIKLIEGQIVATSTTENATCNTTITSEDFKSVDTNSPIILSGVYNVSSYAHAPGYLDSETVTAAIKWGNPSIQVSNNAMHREARKDEAKKCAEPEITLIAGGFVATSATENSTCHTTITSEDLKNVDTNEPIAISGVYNISSYAHAEGYQNSDAVAALLVWVDPINQGTTNILSPKTKKAVVIKARGNNVQISGTERGERIQLYSLDGMLLDSVTAADGETTIPHSLQQGHIYIIKYGNKSVKYKY